MNRDDFIVDRRELNGALADLGTLLPLMLGAIVVAGLPPLPIVLGFGLFYLLTAVVYRLPVPVQPMKAIAAVMLLEGVTPGGLAASGVMLGLILLVLAATGWIDRIARLMPQSVLAGLQLGLGVGLAVMAVDLVSTQPLLGLACLAALLVAMVRWPGAPVVAVVLVASMVAAWWLGLSGPQMTVPSSAHAMPAWPAPDEVGGVLGTYVLPQLSITLTNAILLTALVARDYFGERAAHVTPRRLAVTSGLANLALAPFGALPMCHGAGGLAAHVRHGARGGGAPLVLGLGLIVLALLPAGAGLTLMALVPSAALGALLVVAAWEIAVTKRLFDSRPACWPTIAVTAMMTVAFDPFVGLLAGFATETATSRLRAPKYDPADR